MLMPVQVLEYRVAGENPVTETRLIPVIVRNRVTAAGENLLGKGFLVNLKLLGKGFRVNREAPLAAYSTYVMVVIASVGLPCDHCMVYRECRKYRVRSRPIR
jgi:hypothetical protein